MEIFIVVMIVNTIVRSVAKDYIYVLDARCIKDSYEKQIRKTEDEFYMYRES